MATVLPIGVPVATRRRKKVRTITTPRPASPKQLKVRQLFREAALYCKQAVAHLAPGQKRAAYNTCIRNYMKGRYVG